MSKELQLIIEQVSDEKGLSKEQVIKVLENALEMIYRRQTNHDQLIRVAINPKNGTYQGFRRWLVISSELQVEDPHTQISIDQLDINEKHLLVGDYRELALPQIEFGRIAVQQAKQAMMQKIREEEKLQIVSQFKNKVGTIVSGEVSRMEREKIFIELGNGVELVLLKQQLIPTERIRLKDRIRVYLKDVRSDFRGPCLLGSRTDPQFLVKLFEIEVPEIGQGLITIMGAARDPGSRAKLSVRSHDAKLEPIGACVGMRGQRVQAVSNELGGERVDIILWDSNPAQYVINAMSPVDIKNIYIDEDTHTMNLVVASEKLSQAIGKGGQNVKLASELTGWSLNVLDETQYQEQTLHDHEASIQLFKQELHVDDEVARILVEEGYIGIEELAFSTLEDLKKIPDLHEPLITELYQRANDALVKKALEVKENKSVAINLDSSIHDLKILNHDLINLLIQNNITIIGHLSDLSTDELLDICPQLQRVEAERFIMEARKISLGI
ncbi:MAG: transcription termination factor NusA [Methylacidiphilales bacterium]|nr:transcription termination factor NusA [Candidatus Methylacidiphilales bacterium]